jgi:hypothetical protein
VDEQAGLVVGGSVATAEHIQALQQNERNRREMADNVHLEKTQQAIAELKAAVQQRLETMQENRNKTEGRILAMIKAAKEYINGTTQEIAKLNHDLANLQTFERSLNHPASYKDALSAIREQLPRLLVKYNVGGKRLGAVSERPLAMGTPIPENLPAPMQGELMQDWPETVATAELVTEKVDTSELATDLVELPTEPLQRQESPTDLTERKNEPNVVSMFDDQYQQQREANAAKQRTQVPEGGAEVVEFATAKTDRIDRRQVQQAKREQPAATELPFEHDLDLADDLVLDEDEPSNHIEQDPDDVALQAAGSLPEEYIKQEIQQTAEGEFGPNNLDHSHPFNLHPNEKKVEALRQASGRETTPVAQHELRNVAEGGFDDHDLAQFEATPANTSKEQAKNSTKQDLQRLAAERRQHQENDIKQAQ